MFRVKPWTRIVSACFLALIPLLSVVMVAGYILFWGFGIDRLGDNTLIIASAAPVPDRRLVGFFAALVPGLFVLMALGQLFRMFFNIYVGKGLVSKTVSYLRRFSIYALLAASTAVVLSGAMRWALGVFDTAPLWTHLHVSPVHLAVLFMAGVTFVASQAIEDGVSFAQEVLEYV